MFERNDATSSSIVATLVIDCERDANGTSRVSLTVARWVRDLPPGTPSLMGGGGWVRVVRAGLARVMPACDNGVLVFGCMSRGARGSAWDAGKLLSALRSLDTRRRILP